MRNTQARRLATIAGAVFGFLLCPVGAPPSVHAATAQVIQWDLPNTAGTGPGALIIDPTGALGSPSPAGTVLYVTRGVARLVRFTPGNPVESAPAAWTAWSLEAGQFGSSGGLAITSGDLVYVRFTKSILSIDPTSNLRTRWDWTETGSGGNSDIAVDASGNVWTATPVSGGRLQKLTPSGSVTNAITRWAVGGGAGGVYLSGVAVYSGESEPELVYYSEPNSNNIGELNPSTNQVRRWALGPLGVVEPRQLTISSSGDVWVVTGSNHLVRLNPSTNQVTVYPIPTASSNPVGITANAIIGFTESTAGSPPPKIGALTPDGTPVTVTPSTASIAPVFITPTKSTATVTPTSGPATPVSTSTTLTTSGSFAEAQLPAGSFSPLGIGHRATDAASTFYFSVGSSTVSPNRIGRVAIVLDSTKPIIKPTIDPPPNPAGWNNTNVTVTWGATDPESGISSSSGCDSTTLTVETPGTILTCTATNGAGLTDSVSVTVKLDKTPPTLTFGAATPAANAAGWNNTNVSVPYTAADSLSGVATTSLASPLVLTAEGAALSGTVVVTDVAGNSAAFTSATFKIDKTKPVIVGSRLPLFNANGWNNVDVTVSFTCNDVVGTGGPPAVSGIDSNTIAGATVATEGLNQFVTNTGSCTDKAGNTANAVTVSNINIDKTKPVIAGSRLPLPNANGWNNVDVTVGFTCADTGSVQSGIASNTVAGGATLTGEGANQAVTNTGSCTDKADNVALFATVSNINIDKTPPTTTKHVTDADGDGFLDSQNMTLSATDALSGVASISHSFDGGAPDTATAFNFPFSGPTASNGTGGGPKAHTFAFFATDLAGNVEATNTVPMGYPDNCPSTPNPASTWADIKQGIHTNEQQDSDLDGLGNLCDSTEMGPAYVNTASTDADITLPNSEAGFAPGQQIAAQVSVVFTRVDTNGDGIPDSYAVVTPDPYNVHVHIFKNGQPVAQNRVPVGPAIHIPGDLNVIPGGLDACPPNATQTADGNCILTTTILLNDLFTNLGPGTYELQAFYENHITDPELSPTCTSPTQGGCFPNIFQGNADAGFTDFTIVSPTAGGTGGTGAPFAIKSTVTLNTVKLAGGSATKVVIPKAHVRVFDRNSAAFQNTVTALGTAMGISVPDAKNPDGSFYAAIFEMAQHNKMPSAVGQIGACITAATGVCYAGISQTGDFLVIVKFSDTYTPDPAGNLPSGRKAYVGRPGGISDFGSGVATKEIQFIKVFDKNGKFFEFRGGSKSVVTGSYLEVITPDSAVWTDTQSVYPFIFTSDSSWTANVCVSVPGGYSVVGVYDANGNLAPATGCQQTLVANQTMVIAFAVADMGSPEPSLTATLSLKSPKGPVTNMGIKISDIRKKTLDAGLGKALGMSLGNSGTRGNSGTNR